MGTNNKVEIDQLYGGLLPSEADQDWYVVHTKPRWEKKLAQYLYKYGINYFLPLQESVREYGKRKVTFKVPLFPGYIFLKCHRDDKSTILRSGCVVRFLSVPSEQELLTSLQYIYQSILADAPVKAHAYVKEGYQVRITEGPYKDIEGVVIDAEDPAVVIIGIHLIQQAICVEVDPSQVELVSRTYSL